MQFTTSFRKSILKFEKKKYTENEIAKRYMDEEKYYKIREQTYYMSHRTYSSNHNYILDMTFSITYRYDFMNKVSIRQFDVRL